MHPSENGMGSSRVLLTMSVVSLALGLSGLGLLALPLATRLLGGLVALALFGAAFGLWLMGTRATSRQQLLGRALDVVDEPLALVSQTGEVLFVNRAWEQRTRRQREQLSGQPIFGLFDAALDVADFRAALDGTGSHPALWRRELPLFCGEQTTPCLVEVTRTDAASKTWSLVRLLEPHKILDQERLERMLRALPDIVLQVDQHGDLLQLHGPPSIRDKIVVGVSMLAAIPPDVMPPDVVSQALQLTLRALASGEHHSLEFKMQNDGEDLDYVARLIPDNRASEVLIFVREISDRKQLERALEMTQLSFRNIIERNLDGIAIIDQTGIVRFVNPAARQFFHRGGAVLGELFDYPLVIGASTEIEIVLDVQADGFEVLGIGEMRLMETKWVDGDAYLASIRDITERKHAENRLQHQAFHDLLTGLPNRALFLERLGQAIDRRQQQPTYGFAVLFMDLDRFKNVNDSLGHDAGDMLLVQIASRLTVTLGESAVISRLGGDEFVVLLEDLRGSDDAVLAAEGILQAFTAPFSIKGQQLYTSCSIGIALSYTGYQVPQDILRDADTAMYRAKELGRSRYAVFDREMHLRAQRLLRLENDLQRAVEQGEFLLYLQPIASLQTGHLTGFEVLVRWMHPREGIINPGDFIEIAEDTGLIIPIGWWVMRAACELFCQWHQRWPTLPPLRVSVNLSARQIAQPDLVVRVLSILRETGLPSSQLKLEITESALIEHVEEATIRLEELRQHDVQIHMDDFGTGFSSLSYLHRFPLDGLKIDRAFVNGMEHNRDNAEIVRTIVSMAHSLGLSVTAEGAEESVQIGMLQQLGCERVQGFALGRPMETDKAAALFCRPDCFVPLIKAAAEEVAGRPIEL